jgi:hypothetical protein
VESLSFCAVNEATPSPRDPERLDGPAAEGEQNDREHDQDEEESLLVCLGHRPSFREVAAGWLRGRGVLGLARRRRGPGRVKGPGFRLAARRYVVVLH